MISVYLKYKFTKKMTLNNEIRCLMIQKVQ